MRKPRLLPALLPFLLLPALTSCGEKEQSWTDASSAYQAAEAAKASSDMETALKAYEFAAGAEGAAPAERYGALLGLAEVQARLGQISAAEATFAKVQANHADLLDVRGMRRMADAWIHAGQSVQATTVVTAALERYPDQGEAFATIRKAIEALESGDSAALAELGYVGD